LVIVSSLLQDFTRICSGTALPNISPAIRPGSYKRKSFAISRKLQDLYRAPHRTDVQLETSTTCKLAAFLHVLPHIRQHTTQYRYSFGAMRAITSGKYPVTSFWKKKRRVFLCFTPPENEFGNQLFLDSRFLVDFSAFSLVQARTSPKK